MKKIYIYWFNYYYYSRDGSVKVKHILFCNLQAHLLVLFHFSKLKENMLSHISPGTLEGPADKLDSL